MSNIKRTAERENLSAVLFCDFLVELKNIFMNQFFLNGYILWDLHL